MPLSAARSDRELHMLETLVDCAYAFGVTFSQAAEAEADPTAKLALCDAFLRSSQAVRMGIRLSLTLRAPPKPAAIERERPERIEVERIEVERIEVEALDIERPEREPIERERERDYEPVSLPRFLAALGVVATEADRLADHLPADVAAHTLPALRDLLAEAGTEAPAAPRPTGGGVAILVRPPPIASRAALLGSASVTLPQPAAVSRRPRPPPPRGPG